MAGTVHRSSGNSRGLRVRRGGRSGDAFSRGSGGQVCPRLQTRRGAVAVEFACVAPLMLAVIVGLLELSRIYHVQNVLETAAREGARFAGLDRSGLMLQNQTSNQKLIKDVKNYLATNDINPADVTVRVVKASDPTQDFDLDDPANELQMFQVRIEVPYNKVCYSKFTKDGAAPLSAVLTYRNGRAPVAP